uniref:Semaphorin-4G n=1 Tax=Callorhinchus milii TaxID=7868 RepID=A0A4W3GT03_CALMI
RERGGVDKKGLETGLEGGKGGGGEGTGGRSSRASGLEKEFNAKLWVISVALYLSHVSLMGQTDWSTLWLSLLQARQMSSGIYLPLCDAALSIVRLASPDCSVISRQCITDDFRKKGFKTSRDLPDLVLDFVKKHPVMAEDVLPVGRRPLFVRKNVNYTKIAVDTVTGVDNMQYDVLFIGTVDGWLHKIVKVGSHMHAIEEIQVYKEPQPVESVVISRTQRMVYVGSQSAVIQLPRASCSKYTLCQDCILARDPDCGWDGEACRQITGNENRSQLTQDIVSGNNGCLTSSADVRNKKVTKGSTILLECQFRSNLAVSKWRFNREDLATREAEHYSLERQALLIKAALVSDSGEYSCYAEENGLEYLVVLYMVSVVESSQPEVPPSHLAQISSGREFLYLTIIVFLGSVAVVTSILAIYLVCSPSKRGKYQVQLCRPSLIELQNVSGSCGPRSEGGSGEEDHQVGFLKIIPGQAPSTNSLHNNRTADLELPPPPPPPPLPPEMVDTPNGLPGLPHVLRKMNGNSYLLLRQASKGQASPHYHSFTEELSRKLEKRKHTQLGEKPDESSV